MPVARPRLAKIGKGYLNPPVTLILERRSRLSRTSLFCKAKFFQRAAHAPYRKAEDRAKRRAC